MNMHTTNYSTRQREICAKIEARPRCTAKAKARGLHSLWGKLWIVRLSGSSSCIEYKLPFHNRPRVCSWAGVKSSLFYVKSDWCGGHRLTAEIWRNIPESPRASSAHKPPLVLLGNYLEGAWLKKGGTRLGISNISQEKTTNAYPVIKRLLKWLLFVYWCFPL